jgi:putative ABC transport system permease protein
VLAWQDSFLDLPNRRVWVLGVPRRTLAQIAQSQLIEGSLATADARLREGGWAALSQPIAREKHLQLGQRFTLPTPSGNTTLRLAATIGNYGWLPGAIVINGAEHERLWQSHEATQLAVSFKPGVRLAQGTAATKHTLPARAALAVKTSGERRAEVSAVLGSTLSRLNETTLIVLVVTIASVLALMLSAVAQRRGRLSSLISMGMDFRQLSRLVFYETGTPLILGCLTGTLIGLIGQDLIDGWLSHTTGASLRYAPAWQLGLRTLVIATAISLLASIAASVKTARLKPQAAFSTE